MARVVVLDRLSQDGLDLLDSAEEIQYEAYDQFTQGHQAVIAALKKKDTHLAIRILSAHLKEGLELIRNAYFKS